MPACQVTGGRSESCYFSLTKAERDEGCASLSSACLKSCNDPAVSPSGTYYLLLLLLSCFFPILYSCWEQLALLISSSHLRKEDGLMFGSLDGSTKPHRGAEHRSQWLVDTQELLCWDTVCTLAVPLPCYFRGPLTQTFVLPHIDSGGENFHPSEAGWKFSTQMQFPQYKHWPWKKLYFAQSEPKWKCFLTRERRFVPHPPVSPGKTLSFEGYRWGPRLWPAVPLMEVQPSA